MTDESPFFHSRIECPVCKTLNEFETVKVGSYVESGRDSDFRPTGIKWHYPRYQEYNPLVFFTATCSNCYYSREFNKDYEDWKSDDNFRIGKLKSLKEKHLDQLARENSILKQMGEGIDLSRFPNQSAIIKLLLAIFDEQLSDRYSNLDIGRWYLRIAWIFRDLGKTDNPNVSFLKGMMAEIENRHSQLWQSIESLKEQSAVFAKHVSAHFQSNKISAELKSQMLPFRDKFNDSINGLNNNVEDTVNKLNIVQHLIDEYKDSTIGADGTGNGAAFGKSSSFTEYLGELKENWDGIVVNEKQALEKAVEYYKKAFEENKDIEAGNQLIQASYLIAELSRRIGSFEQANAYFCITIKHGQEFIYRHREDQSQTALARKILELAIEQNRTMNDEMESIRK